MDVEESDIIWFLVLQTFVTTFTLFFQLMKNDLSLYNSLTFDVLLSTQLIDAMFLRMLINSEKIDIIEEFSLQVAFSGEQAVDTGGVT